MQWDRFVNQLLFAYKEVSQESRKFAPFQLLHGRTLRGLTRYYDTCGLEAIRKRNQNRLPICFRPAGDMRTPRESRGKN